MGEKIDAVEFATNMRIGKGKNAPSLEWCYAEHAKQDEDVCVELNDGMVYRWNGNFWNLQTREEETKSAWKVVALVEPTKANPRVAESVAKSVVYGARPLPFTGKTVIPVKGAYLHLEEEAGEICLKAYEPKREDGITYLIDTVFAGKIGDTYQPRQTFEGTLFGKFISEVLPDPEVRELVRRYIGYTLIPDTRYQVFQVWLGNGSNGKSVLARIVRRLHRRAEAFELGVETDFNKENLIGASLILVDEAPKDKQVKSEIIKKFISGESIQINRKFKTVVSTTVQAKWIINTNHVFRVNDESDGFFRRIVPVEFTQKFEGDRVDAMLEDKICESELDVVLDWALGGLVELVKEGGFRKLPKATIELKDKFKVANDPILQWIRDESIYLSKPGEDDRDTPKNDVFHAYEAFCEANRRQCCSSESFWTRMTHIFPDMKGRERQRFVDIKGVKTRKRFVPVMLDGMPDVDHTPDFSQPTDKVYPLRLVNGKF